MHDALKALQQKRELFQLTRAAYFASIANPDVSLIASVSSEDDFRAVGQYWRPQQSVGRYQAEINRQTPFYRR